MLVFLCRVRKTSEENSFIDEFKGKLKKMLETENEYFTDLIDYLSKNNKSKNWQKYLAGKEVLAD